MPCGSTENVQSLGGGEWDPGQYRELAMGWMGASDAAAMREVLIGGQRPRDHGGILLIGEFVIGGGDRGDEMELEYLCRTMWSAAQGSCKRSAPQKEMERNARTHARTHARRYAPQHRSRIRSTLDSADGTHNRSRTHVRLHARTRTPTRTRTAVETAVAPNYMAAANVQMSTPRLPAAAWEKQKVAHGSGARWGVGEGSLDPGEGFETGKITSTRQRRYR
ncbi:hypothetical protein DFH27DRAFT_523117 [Peziza echinospora]|nr:hypothetical protein DFH27DRAFT_523117 [Peziza echinospora]